MYRQVLTTMYKWIYLSLFSTFAIANQYIECPIPESSSKTCEDYSACELHIPNSCSLKDSAGYRVSSLKQITNKGFKVTLEKENETETLFEQDISQLILEVIQHEEYHLQVKIYDADANRYEIPYELNLPETGDPTSLYDVHLSDVNKTFSFEIRRKSTGTILWKTLGPLTFEDQFIQISTLLPSSHLYGIGEHHHVSLLHNFEQRITYPLFARGQPVDQADVNEYGSHPYYINIEDGEGNSHSVLLYNSNALEFSTFTAGDSKALTMRSIGGIIDLHFFLGPSPEELNIQYTKAIGRPAFPPYWSLGFHMSRWEYNSTNRIREIHQRNSEAGIPQDVQILDIDYMEKKNQFTYDPQQFRDLPQLVQELRDDGIRTVLIFEPVLSINADTWSSTERGFQADVFIKWINNSHIPQSQPASTNNYIAGHVWPPEKVYFIDFLNPNAIQFWKQEIQLFMQNVHFDGMWIDMNEPKNFKTNVMNPNFADKEDSDWTLICPETPLDDPPYPTRAANLSVSESFRLSDITICLSATQTDGEMLYRHYDVHNLYGHSQAIATHKALKELMPGKRPFILSRSTFPGSGRYTFHWLGDNTASWEHLRRSVIGMLEFNLFGIPMVGADVCGFIQEPTEELCVRWMQLGAFYPFDRNHNGRRVADQDPAYPGWTKVASVSRDVLLLRYKYLPYLYYLFHKAHYYGNSVVRPLFNVFSSDMDCRTIDDQFLWGDAIMVAPVVVEGATSRDVYFPDSIWYDLRNGNRSSSGQELQTVSAPLEDIRVYIRGGKIVPWQIPAITTTRSRENSFGLTIALNASDEAEGEIFWDDGVSQLPLDQTFAAVLSFASDILLLEVDRNEQLVAGLQLSNIDIFGYGTVPTTLYVNELPTDSADWQYNPNEQVLSISLDVPLGEDLSLRVA